MKFSIIVPVYNRADIIRETLPHMLSQDYEDFEVIVVDDGSTDNTFEVLSSFQDSRLKIYKKENGERGAARNFGAKKASGYYLNFFDCDDWMYSNHLSTAYHLASIHNLPVLFHVCYELKDEQGKVLETVSIPSGGTAKALIYNNFLACNAVFVKRDEFLANPFNEDRNMASAEDWEIWLRMLSRYPIVGSNEITYAMQMHSGRSLNTISPEKIEARNLAMNAALLKDKPFRAFYKNQVDFFIANSLVFIALNYANNPKTKGKAADYLVRSVKWYFPIMFSKRFIASLKNVLIKKQ